MDRAPPAVVRVLPDPTEPGRFKWHLFDADDMPLDPVIMSDSTYGTEGEAQAAGEAAMANHKGAA